VAEGRIKAVVEHIGGGDTHLVQASKGADSRASTSGFIGLTLLVRSTNALPEDTFRQRVCEAVRLRPQPYTSRGVPKSRLLYADLALPVGRVRMDQLVEKWVREFTASDPDGLGV
jgi:hypothetical protein